MAGLEARKDGGSEGGREGGRESRCLQQGRFAAFPTIPCSKLIANECVTPIMTSGRGGEKENYIIKWF